MENFSDYCRDTIIDALDSYEGQDVYTCDLAYTLTETMNADGTCTYSSAEAKDYIKEWWDEAGEYWEYENDNFGEHRWNPFDDPEAFMVCMVIEGVASMLSQCATIDENWNDSIELTAEIIEKIKEEVAEVTARF